MDVSSAQVTSMCLTPSSHHDERTLAAAEVLTTFSSVAVVWTTNPSEQLLMLNVFSELWSVTLHALRFIHVILCSRNPCDFLLCGTALWERTTLCTTILLFDSVDWGL